MFAELTLAGTYRETQFQAKSVLRRSAGELFLFDRFYRQCDRIRNDRRITRVLVRAKSSFATTTVAALEEIHDELRRIVESGTEVYFSASDYRDAHLYLASACSRRTMHPLGSLRCAGLARNSLFFKRLADRLGIRVQVARRGKYKSAMDRFRLDTIDDANLEQYQLWLDTSAERLHESILTGYRIDRPQLDRLLDGALLDAKAACEAGWIDETISAAGLVERWKQEKVRRKRIKPKKHARGKRVAVLVFEGSILEGRNRMNPLVGQAIGADTFVKHIDTLRKKRSVRGVVLRVSSGGGSAIASEDIRTALARLAEEKPLVVSMSEIAGSGGYWIATAGAAIYALATTLTGSIGVINVAADVGAALAKQGVTHSTVRTHPHADAASGLRPLTEDELAELDGQVASIYDRFIELVAKSRDLDPAEVHERAQGRIWSGLHAHANRLVDHIGGLTAAIEDATRRAGLERPRFEFYPEVRYSFLERLLYGSGSRAGVDLRSIVDLWSTGLGIRAALASISEIANQPLLLDPRSLLDADLRLPLDADIEIE